MVALVSLFASLWIFSLKSPARLSEVLVKQDHWRHQSIDHLSALNSDENRSILLSHLPHYSWIPRLGWKGRLGGLWDSLFPCVCAFLHPCSAERATSSLSLEGLPSPLRQVHHLCQNIWPSCLVPSFRIADAHNKRAISIQA